MGAGDRCGYRGTDDRGVDLFPSVAAGDGPTKAKDHGDPHDQAGTTQAQTDAPATKTRGASEADSETGAQTQTHTQADSPSGGTSPAAAQTAARQNARTAGAGIHAAGNTARAKSGSASGGGRPLCFKDPVINSGKPTNPGRTAVDASFRRDGGVL